VELIYFRPEEKPYGLTYGQWTVKWWQWLLAIPRDQNPALDETGSKVERVQANPYVSFLTGTFVNTINTPRRTVALPSDKSILFPAINYQANFIEDPIFKNESELKRHVSADIDDIARHDVLLDGEYVPSFRVASDPSLFPVQIANDLPHGTNGVDTGWVDGKGGQTDAVSDGYWTFLRPLPRGKHNIHLAGSCTGGARKTEAYYDISIV
jgi:hypothetical protein